MVAILLALSLIQEAPADRDKLCRDAVDRGVVFPEAAEIEAWKRKGLSHRRVLEYYLDKAVWARALRAADARTGLFRGNLEIRVKFAKLAPDNPATGDGIDGKGVIQLDVEALAQYWRRRDEYERAKENGVVVVPPASALGVLTHELTHCFTGMGQPLWFLEGIATYAAADGHFVAFFRNERQKVQDIEADIGAKYRYARGWAFFEYVKAGHGDEKLRKLLDLTIGAKKPVAEAAAGLLGLTWEQIKAEERAWSEKWVAAYRVRK